MIVTKFGQGLQNCYFEGTVDGDPRTIQLPDILPETLYIQV
jgi:hypothetical protein